MNLQTNPLLLRVSRLITQYASPLRIYLYVYGALLVLLALTVAAAYLDIGPWGVVVALAIAIVKALLVILYFMHVRHSDPLVWIFVIAGFFWLALLLVGIMQDYVARGWVGG
jgi:cytochrome c oxidase subunit 4